jgi:hypothetical protein
MIFDNRVVFSFVLAAQEQYITRQKPINSSSKSIILKIRIQDVNTFF